jgi:pilus assembly protein FimV
MLKKQAFAVLVALMSLIGSAFGLGLGEIDVKSNLNDPLEAEIKLIQLQGLTAGEILPTLASNDDFRRAGVERSFFLSNISFRVRENESGDLVVHLTTRQAVREPFLNFLVEINWPGGRLLKEYTVLLDPPVFDTGLAVDALVVDSDSSTGTSILGTDLVTTTVVDTPDASTSTTVAAQPVEPREDNLPSGQYRVQRNDTLWEIALKVPGREGYSPQQVMLAIQDLNPQAFLNNNINRVKAGSVLTLPDGRQMSVRSFQEAIEEVQAQNRGAAPNLRSPVAESSDVQLSATDSTSSALPSSDSERNPDGYLELTSDSESSTTSASGDAAATIDRLQNQLSVAEELNDQFERERDELESRIDELNEQIAIMERLLDVQNSDLAEVQQALADNADSTADATADQSTQTDAAAAVDTTADAATDQAATTSQPTTQTATPAVTTPTTPVQQPVQTGPAGFMGFVNELMRTASDWVMASITNMAITGAALLLLILLPLYVRSKRAGSNKTLSEMTAVEEESYEEVSDLEGDFDEDLLAEVEDDFEEEEIDEPETLDAVVEAEMYMAYQKYDQAEEKLKEAFSEHPDRADVGLKLLEVYAETGDANAFNELENRLSLNSEEKGQVAELRAKLPIGGVADVSELGGGDLDDDLNLGLDTGPDSNEPDLDLGGDLDFDLDLDHGTTATEDSAEELDFNLNEDASDGMLDLDLGEDEPSLGDPTMSDPEPEEDLSTDLDFSLDLGDLDEPAETSETGDDLDFSLDGLEDESLDLDLSTDSATEESLTEESSDLDFSLELEQDGPTDQGALDSGLDFSSEEPSLDLDSDLGSLDVDSGLDLDLGDEPESGTESDLELSLDDSDLDLGSTDFDSEALDLDTGSEPEVMDTELTLGEEELSLDTGLDAEPFAEEPELASDNTEIDLGDSADPLEQLASSLDSDAELEEDEFDFLSGNDEASTKLDLARAYIEMDDKEGARDILEEVAAEGNDDQKAQAQELMAQL